MDEGDFRENEQRYSKFTIRHEVNPKIDGVLSLFLTHCLSPCSLNQLNLQRDQHSIIQTIFGNYFFLFGWNFYF